MRPSFAFGVATVQYWGYRWARQRARRYTLKASTPHRPLTPVRAAAGAWRI